MGDWSVDKKPVQKICTSEMCIYVIEKYRYEFLFQVICMQKIYFRTIFEAIKSSLNDPHNKISI